MYATKITLAGRTYLASPVFESNDDLFWWCVRNSLWPSRIRREGGRWFCLAKTKVGQA